MLPRTPMAHLELRPTARRSAVPLEGAKIAMFDRDGVFYAPIRAERTQGVHLAIPSDGKANAITAARRLYQSLEVRQQAGLPLTRLQLRCRHRRVRHILGASARGSRTSYHMLRQIRRVVKFLARICEPKTSTRAPVRFRPPVQPVRRGPDALRIEMTQTRRFGLGLPEQDRRSAGRVDASCPCDAQRAGNATALLWPDPRPPDHIRPERGFGLDHCSKFLG